jgi:hypothetical protein
LNQHTFDQLSHDQQDNVLRELHDRGFTYTQLHHLTGLSTSWVRRRVLKLGVTPRPRRGPRPLSVPPHQVAKDYKAGASIEGLAEKYDSYYKQVRQALLDEGVVLRPSTKAKPYSHPQPIDHTPHRR